MKNHRRIDSQSVADTIEKRAGSGTEAVVQGWQKMLSDLLKRIDPQLRDGALVTFHTIESNEKSFFETLHQNISVPAEVRAVFISPSVRHQMMFERRHRGRQPVPEHDHRNPPDYGVLLAYRRQDFQTIVNVLFAKPPYSAAADVYENGRLLAGYVYEDVEACIAQLTEVLRIHLQRAPSSVGDKTIS